MGTPELTEDDLEDNNYTPRGETGLFTLEDGVGICTLLEDIVPKYGFHIALTGGTLYGNGGRKDIDVVFYRIRQVHNPALNDMYVALQDKLNMRLVGDFGFCKKFVIDGADGSKIFIDALFPEDAYGTYGLHEIQNGDIEKDGSVIT